MMIERKASLARYKNGDYVIKITFPFDEMDVRRVKLLPGRKYNSTGKFWTAPITEIAIEMLRTWKWDVDDRLLSYLKEGRTNINELKPLEEIKGLKKTLYDYQKKGVSFINAKHGRALIADEMGLGKTVQAIAWLQMHPEIKRVLIVVPASLKLNWKREIEMWMNNPEVEILNGTTHYAISCRIVIINYDILSSWLTELLAWKPEVIVADEVQYVKSNKAQRTKAIKKLAKGVNHFIALSGTPIVNRPIEFYNAIQMIDPKLYPNYWDFTDKYCGRKHTGFGWNVNGATNTKELHTTLKATIMIRRLKSEVLKDLPDKIYSFFPLEMTADGYSEYKSAESNLIAWIRENKGRAAAERASNAAVLAEIEVLKQLAVRAKMNHALSWIEDFLDTGEKLVVFATHKFVIEEIMTRFGNKAVKIDGSVSGTNRQLAMDKFQNDAETRLFVGNIQAAGVGITLTAASNVAFLELPWVSAAVTQAEDRCHRIGQKNAVNVYYLLSENTIEEKLVGILHKKAKILNQILDGAEADDTSVFEKILLSFE